MDIKSPGSGELVIPYSDLTSCQANCKSAIRKWLDLRYTIDRYLITYEQAWNSVVSGRMIPLRIVRNVDDLGPLWLEVE